MTTAPGGSGEQRAPHDDDRSNTNKMTNTISDNVTALRIRIPVIPHEEEDQEELCTDEYEYEQYREEEYNPYADLENYYACLEYYELLRQARNQTDADFWGEDSITPVSPIPFMDEWM